MRILIMIKLFPRNIYNVVETYDMSYAYSIIISAKKLAIFTIIYEATGWLPDKVTNKNIKILNTALTR